MLKTKHWLIEIRDLLKRIWAASLVLVILASILGCSHEQKRKHPRTEIWLIDAKEATLFRSIDDNYEQVIPIKDNQSAMDNFMCIDNDELDFQFEQRAE